MILFRAFFLRCVFSQAVNSHVEVDISFERSTNLITRTRLDISLPHITFQISLICGALRAFDQMVDVDHSALRQTHLSIIIISHWVEVFWWFVNSDVFVRGLYVVFWCVIVWVEHLATNSLPKLWNLIFNSNRSLHLLKFLHLLRHQRC